LFSAHLARFCHPDKASNASGRKDLGQLRAAKPVPVSEIAQRSFADVVGCKQHKK
jgi:hypothetical protein